MGTSSTSVRLRPEIGDNMPNCHGRWRISIEDGAARVRSERQEDPEFVARSTPSMYMGTNLGNKSEKGGICVADLIYSCDDNIRLIKIASLPRRRNMQMVQERHVQT